MDSPRETPQWTHVEDEAVDALAAYIVGGGSPGLVNRWMEIETKLKSGIYIQEKIKKP